MIDNFNLKDQRPSKMECEGLLNPKADLNAGKGEIFDHILGRGQCAAARVVTSFAS